MKNKKNAFTMIELVFTIVIIGILAAVAVPKLAATRDDARVSTCMNDARGFMQELTAYYTANGDLALISKITNLPVEVISGNGFILDLDMSKKDGSMLANGYYMCDGTIVALFEPSYSSTEANITITNFLSKYGTPDTITQDMRVGQLAANGLEKANFFRTYQLGGSNIKF